MLMAMMMAVALIVSLCVSRVLIHSISVFRWYTFYFLFVTEYICVLGDGGGVCACAI